ncbi:hypothetical protein AB0D97_35010 [Streptomyces roseus]|uniref:hypothetical protein n=1 Tax=Streptomyces roseus TaxID=66430 RepID=UPI0033FF3393
MAGGADRFAVVGHTLGTELALRMTTRHPHWAPLDDQLRTVRETWRGLVDRPTSLGAHLLDALFGDEHLAAVSEERRQVFVRRAAIGVPPGSYEQLTMAPYSGDMRDDLPRIASPCLVIVARLTGRMSPTGRPHRLEQGHRPAT